jgi:CHAD domain-containing protein
MRVRRDLPDSVHQMRVAARRLRSGLRVFRPLVDEEWSRHLRDELGWAASELGLSRDSEVLLALLDALVDAANHPRLTEAADAPGCEALPPLFGKAWRKLAKEVKALTLHGPAEEWHETRITAKRARYAAEALVPVFGAPAKGLASALSNVTEQLGEHQDASIAQETCRALAAEFDGPTGFALGLLHAYEGEQELVARVRLQEQWPAVRDLAKRTTLG